jgi:hypothetical protein
VVLDWSIGHDDCKTAVRNPAGYACRSNNSFCSDATSGRGYICKCNQGFDGNPYLPDGCKGTVNYLPSHPFWPVLTTSRGSCSPYIFGYSLLRYFHVGKQQTKGRHILDV